MSVQSPLEKSILMVMGRAEALLHGASCSPGNLAPSETAEAPEGAWGSWRNSWYLQHLVHKLPETHAGCRESPEVVFCLGSMTRGLELSPPCLHPPKLWIGRLRLQCQGAYDADLGRAGAATCSFQNLWVREGAFLAWIPYNELFEWQHWRQALADRDVTGNSLVSPRRDFPWCGLGREWHGWIWKPQNSSGSGNQHYSIELPEENALHCLKWQLHVAAKGLLEMWLVQLRNWIFNFM